MAYIKVLPTLSTLFSIFVQISIKLLHYNSTVLISFLSWKTQVNKLSKLFFAIEYFFFLLYYLLPLVIFTILHFKAR